MAIVAPSFVPKYNPSAYMWKGISDIFGDITQMREDKLQRQRQETLDAQRLTAAQSVERNRQQIYDQRAAEAERLEGERALIKSREIGPADYGRLRGTQVDYAADPFGEKMYGTDAGPSAGARISPTRQDAFAAEFRLGRDLDRDTALNVATLNKDLRNSQLHIGNLEKQRLDIIGSNLSNIDKDILIKQNKIKLNEAIRKRDEATQRKLSLETLVGARGVPSEVQVREEFGEDPDQALYRAEPGMRSFEKAYKNILLSGKDLTKDQRKAAGLADVTSGKTFWERMKTDSGQTATQMRSTLADEMKKIASNIKDYSDDAGDVLDSVEQSQIAENLFKAAAELGKKYPDKSVYDIYISLKSHPRNYVDFTDVGGWDDAAPMKLQQIKDAYDALISGETNQEQATNRSTSSNKTPEQREIDFQKMYRIYQEKMGGKLSYEAWRQTL